MLGGDFALQDLRSHLEIGEVVEDGETFAANAQLKAVTVSREVPGLVLADDSGLEVDSLGGLPGVRSARYAGEEASDAANRKKLLGALAALPAGASRTARFRCVLVLARGGEVVGVFEGAAEGAIIEMERGAEGFGYDPLFLPTGFERTFAELSRAEKNALSHRGAAVAQLRTFLRSAPL